MWLGVGSFAVGLPAYLAATVFIRCPASYEGMPCREVEGPIVLAGLVVFGAIAVCLAGAVTGCFAILRREPPTPALVPIVLILAIVGVWGLLRLTGIPGSSSW